ncbi:hypothetical protein P4S73_01260 [Paraglaciecola sp. Hal342]
MRRKKFKVIWGRLFTMIGCSVSIYTYAESLEINEKITVTATRQPIAITQADSSVSIIDSSEIDEVGHQHINQLFHSVPGGWISRGNGQEHLICDPLTGFHPVPERLWRFSVCTRWNFVKSSWILQR